MRNEKPNAVAAAIQRARKNYPKLKVEVEADKLEQVAQAVEAGADIILLDNMTPEQLRQAVKIAKGRAKTEASGGVNLANRPRDRRQRGGFHLRRRAHAFRPRGGHWIGF